MSNGACAHPLHLSFNDLRLLKALEVTPWACPACAAAPQPAPPAPATPDFETDVE